MTRKFEASDDLIAELKDIIAEQQVFSQNGVTITLRTPVRAPETATFMVQWNENGEKAYRPFNYIEQALDFASDHQR